MPEMDGVEVLRQLHQRGLTEKIPIFLITANTDAHMIREAYELGVMDVISKPVIPYVVLRRVQSVVELYRARRELSRTVDRQRCELLEQARHINQLNQGMIEALSSVIEFRDGVCGGHVRRIYDITKILLTHTKFGDSMDAETIEHVAQAAIMHDVGKIAISDTILNKPGRLTPEEYAVMQTHALRGAEMLEQIPQLRENGSYNYAYDIARHHHERWDGGGYPDGLCGDAITTETQVVSLADVYDALISKRVYKDAFSAEQALGMIRDGQCGVFNPELLRCFFSIEPEIRQLYTKANEEERNEFAALAGGRH